MANDELENYEEDDEVVGMDDEDEEDDDVSSSTTVVATEDTESLEEIAAAAASASVKARNKVRDSMAADIEAFLARGGQIQQIDDNVMQDPPRKPTSNYGSRPI